MVNETFSNLSSYINNFSPVHAELRRQEKNAQNDRLLNEKKQLAIKLAWKRKK